MRHLRRHACLAGVVLAAGLLGAVAVADAVPETRPACVGAAARDVAQACDPGPLRFRVTPPPDLAPITPNAPCIPIRSRRPPATCWFGHRERDARAHVALVGDSHAAAWRASLAVAARRERWYGVTIRRNSCPFSTLHREDRSAHGRHCARWVADTLRWFTSHPQVHTAFFASSAFYAFTTSTGPASHEAVVAGFRSAFAKLPATVTEVVVLRDSFRGAVGTLDCVAGAVRRHRRADLRCALPRSEALPPDPAVEATDGARARAIDLSDLMCDELRCYPVVGGVLVLKDVSHLTAAFASTLGPYLLAAYRASA